MVLNLQIFYRNIERDTPLQEMKWHLRANRKEILKRFARPGITLLLSLKNFKGISYSY